MRKLLSIGFLVVCVCLTLTALAYGEGSLGVNVANPQYNSDVSSAGADKSQLHFSKDGSDVGGWLTSVLDNNFWISSGAVYNAAQGGWIQKSPDGRSIFAGSGAGGFRIYAQEGNPVGGVISNATQRFVIAYNGNVAFGNFIPSYPLQMAGGARCTGTMWVNASSRELKENINELSSSDALLAFNKLNPVTFSYKVENGEKHVGFIAEDVPDLVATPDRKALSTMDIVAVLTKVVQEQQKVISELKEKVDKLEQSK